MSQAKVERNKRIVYLRDVEGRLFWFIAETVSKEFNSRISEKNVIKIYRREKAKESLSK